MTSNNNYNTRYNIFQDWKANVAKGKLVMLLFRIAHLASINKFVFVIMILYSVFYRFFVEWVLGIELPYKLQIGEGMKLFHGQGLVVNDNTVIGRNCVIRHNTTIGSKKNADGTRSRCPRIGNNVDMGAQVCIIGDITIGDNSIIGAGAVVVKDVPPNSIVVGNPGRVIKTIEINN